MRSWRLPLPIRAVLAVVLALGVIALASPAQAQKSGGTLTIVRPTDPVSLDPHTETTAPGACGAPDAEPSGLARGQRHP